MTRCTAILGMPLLMLLLCSTPLAAAPSTGTGLLPGGTTSQQRAVDRHAFSQPSANLSPDDKVKFHLGKALFKRLWVTAPSSTQAADGLGPLYNARSCLQCHTRNGRGHAPRDDAHDRVSMVLRLSVPPRTPVETQALASGAHAFIPEPVYGSQLQDRAIAGHVAEGRWQVRYETVVVSLADGSSVALRRPRYDIDNLAYGPLHPDAMLSPRVAPQMIGLGLLETIREADILALADADDADGDGISGRPNRIGQAGRLGRFGWKAGSPDVDSQSQAAFAIDLGLSVPRHPDPAGDCTIAQHSCRQAPDGNSPQYDNLEAHGQVTDLVNFYVRHLAVPARRDIDHPDVIAGERLFKGIGCGACHRPEFVTDANATDPALAGQTIRPYTDLLLHDMGEGLADHRPEGEASGREWRTPPLWGIGLTPVVTGHSQYLHDGRARNLFEAILWHGGEAQAQRDAVTRLSPRQREQLLRFIASL